MCTGEWDGLADHPAMPYHARHTVQDFCATVRRVHAYSRSQGRRITLRDGWDRERLGVMERVVRAKFPDTDLAAKLMATEKRQLVEGNTWRDTAWGCVRGKDGE